MDYEKIITDELAKLNLTELEQIMTEASHQSDGIFTPMSPNQIAESLIQGNPLFDTELIIRNITDLFMFEIKSGILLGVQLVLICIIIGLLKNFSNSFGDKTVSNLGIIVCSCFVIAYCLKNFTYTYNACADSIDTMTTTMQILIPILIPLLIATGSITAGSLMNPVMAAAITIFGTILQKFILPAIFISTVFILINSMTERDYVRKLAIFIRSAAVFVTGLSMTLFAGLTAIQGIVASSADGLLINTAKYSISNFIPIAGGFAADSIEMIMGCMAVIKNGIGLFGIIMILCLLAAPLIKLLAIAVIYKITSIIIEPIGNKEVSECMNEMGNAVITMAVILFLASFMFLIFLTIIIGMGGGSLWR